MRIRRPSGVRRIRLRWERLYDERGSNVEISGTSSDSDCGDTFDINTFVRGSVDAVGGGGGRGTGCRLARRVRVSSSSGGATARLRRGIDQLVWRRRGNDAWLL